MSDGELASNIYLVWARIFQWQKRLTLRMNWQKRPHGLPSSLPCRLCKQSEGGFNIYTLKSSVNVGEDNILLPQQRRARESLIRYYSVSTPDKKCRWPHKNSTKCASQRLISWRVVILPQQFNISILAQGHTGPCRTLQFIRERGHAADKRLYSWACPQWGGILYGNGHQKTSKLLKALYNTSRMLFSLVKPLASWLVIFTVGPRRRMSLKMCLQMIFRY